ncbi:MAG: lipid-binding protein [Flavobacteriales bacterium]|jgi:hypothetical protein|nr:lipid-binding protein [Flavobacteriales bacterium]|tara:strand:+ start:1723 stop:2310 length:588 start_codon:yes stop_codon:yes gene_type:complete
MKKLIVLFSSLFILGAFTLPHTDTYIANRSMSKLVWSGKKLGAEHFGNISLKSGKLMINHGKIVSGDFVIDMNSITNEDLESDRFNTMLVNDLKSSNFFHVEKYPEAHFQIIRATPAEKNKYDVIGQLNLKGNMGVVNFPLELTYNNKTVTATGVCRFNRTKFGITYGSDSFFDNLGDEAISDEIELEFNIVLER